MASSATFPFRYGLFRPLLSVLGMGPAFSEVTIEGDVLRTRMGPWFRADVALAAVTSASRHRGLVGGIGVHGWRGQWLVNGSARGVVQVEIEPPARAHVMGVPVRLRTLLVSVKEPDALIAALSR